MLYNKYGMLYTDYDVLYTKLIGLKHNLICYIIN